MGNAKQARIMIVSAPSACGKDTVIRQVCSRVPGAVRSISCTTREKRCNNGVWEQEGVEYFFMSEEEFHRRVEEGYFAEFSLAGAGDCYGTPAQRLEELLAEHDLVILNVEALGAKSIRRKYPSVASVFLLPPSRDELLRRLRERKSGSEEDTALRMNEATMLMPHAAQYDYCVLNDDLQTAVDQVVDIARSLLPDAPAEACAVADKCRTKRNRALVNRLIREFEQI